jgi:hypothetical protein
MHVGGCVELEVRRVCNVKSDSVPCAVVLGHQLVPCATLNTVLHAHIAAIGCKLGSCSAGLWCCCWLLLCLQQASH